MSKTQYKELYVDPALNNNHPDAHIIAVDISNHFNFFYTILNAAYACGTLLGDCACAVNSSDYDQWLPASPEIGGWRHGGADPILRHADLCWRRANLRNRPPWKPWASPILKEHATQKILRKANLATFK